MNATTYTFTLGQTVTEIQSNAFSNCTGLNVVYFQDASTSMLGSIGGNAFRNASSLSSFFIPASVTSIHDSASVVRTPE